MMSSKAEFDGGKESVTRKRGPYRKGEKKVKPPERFESVILPLFKAFRERHGHLDITRDYKVTADDIFLANGIRGPSSRSLEREGVGVGYHLGCTASNIFAKGAFVSTGSVPDLSKSASRRRALESIGFDWTGNRQFKFLLKALAWFYRRNGHLLVPSVCLMGPVELAEGGLPAHLESYWLGNMVHMVRAKELYVRHNDERRERLDEMGFIWNSHDWKFDNMFLPALVWYKRKTGHLKIPASFKMNQSQIIAASMPSFINEYKLGQHVQAFLVQNPSSSKVLRRWEILTRKGLHLKRLRSGRNSKAGA